MAAVSTPKEIEKSSRLVNVSSKSKNSMTSPKTAISDAPSLSHGIRNVVSTTETLLLPAEEKVDAGLGCHKEMKSSDNGNDKLNLSPFTIRNFVFAVRGEDFSKCWPFRHRILERCLTNGMKLELPPFDPPPKGHVCLGKDEGQEPDFVNGKLEQLASKTEEFIPHNILKESSKELARRGRSTEVETVAKAADKHVSTVQDVASEVETQLEVKPLEQHWAEGLENIQLSGAGARSAATSERSCDSKDMKLIDVEAGVESKPSLLSYAAKTDAMENFVGPEESGTFVSADLKASCTESEGRTAVAKDAKTHSENILGSDIDTGQVLAADSQFHFEQVTNIEGQHPKMKCRSSFERCRPHARVQKLAHMHHLESLVVSDCMNQCQNENQESTGVRLRISDVTTTQTVEHELIGEQNRNESGKTVDNLIFAGIDSEVLAPQVCPVCLNFTSTSNTALNAHIDHCLATVLPGEKTQVRFQKNRIKARKMRSMADICATAPARTLEDLELSCQLWALNQETSIKNVPCTLGWSDGLVRRQPRTPLYRGPAGIWKGNGHCMGEKELQQISPSGDQNPSELGCSFKKRTVTNVASMPSNLGVSSSPKMLSFRNVDCELPESHAVEESNNEGACLEGSSKISQSNVCVKTAAVGMVRQSKILQNLESRSAVGVWEAAERLAVDSFAAGNLSKSHGSKIVNASFHPDVDKVLFGKPTQQSSVRGSSPLPFSSETVHAQFDTNVPVAYHDTAVCGQLESIAIKGKISLDPALNQSCGVQGSLVANKRRKRRNGVLNLISLQDVPKTPERTLLQDQEASDHSWSGTLGFHGIIPVDTSAEEANRLLCRHSRPIDFLDSQQGDVDINEPRGSAEGFPSGLGVKNVKVSQITNFSESALSTKGKEKHFKSFLPDSEGMVAATKKQKFAQTELDHSFKKIANNAVGEQGATDIFVERPMKNKKVLQKVRRIVNLAAVLKDKEIALMAHTGSGDAGSERGVWMDGLEDITLDGEVVLEAAVVNGSSNHQAKRKHFVSTQGRTLGEVSSNTKHARMDLAKEHPSSCNRNLDRATQHFPEGSLVVSNGVLNKHRLQVVADKTNAASLVKEIPHCALVEGTELRDITDELRPLINCRAIARGTLSKNVNEDKDFTGSVEQRKNLDENTNKPGTLSQTMESEKCQPNVDNPPLNPASGSEFSEKEIFTVCREESAFLSRAEGSESVSLLKKTVRSGPSLSVGCPSDNVLNKLSNPSSSGCILATSINSSAVVTDRCCSSVSGEHKPQSSSVSWEAGLSHDLSRFPSIDNINTMHVSFMGTGSVEVSSCAASAAMVNGCLSPGVASSAYADDPNLSAATNALGIKKRDPRIISLPRQSDNPDISIVETPLKQDTLRALHVRAMHKTREVVSTETLQKSQKAMRAVGRDHLFIANRNAQNSSESNASEGLPKVRNVMHSIVDANDLTIISSNQRDYFGREISSSCMAPIMSSTTTSRLLHQENCKWTHRNGALAPSQKLALINQKLAVPSDLFVDVAKTMADVAGSTGGAQDPLFHLFSADNAAAVNNQQRSINSSLQFALSEVHNVSEKMNQMPLQGGANICSTKMGGGPMQSQFPQSAKQMVSGSSSTTTADYINVIPVSLNGPGGVFTVPSNSRMAGEFSSAGMNARRENPSRSEFPSRLSSYDGVSYPDEPGVVHIFGNPVFKLMGKNVMVTNRDAKSTVVGDPVVENGRGFHTAGSVCNLECMGTARGLDLVQDAYGRFPQPLVESSMFMSQGMFASHTGACLPRNPSLTRDNLEVHAHAPAQNAVLPTYGHVEHSGFRHPAMPEPAISMGVSGETLRTFGSAVGVQLERQAVLKPAGQRPAEVIVIDDIFPSSGTFVPSVLHRNGHTVTQQHGMPWLANPFVLSLEKGQIQNQAPAVLCRQEHIAPADFLADLHKLGLGGSSSFPASNQPSGTLSDIVQSSDMSKDRLWSTLSGPMQ